MPLELQLAFCVVARLSVSTPVNVVGFVTPVQESGQLYLKHILKLMAPVLVQEDKLLMVMVTCEPLLETTIHPGRLAVQLAS
jgi:hypothetical protein